MQADSAPTRERVEPALFRHAPRLRETIPWLPLGHFPTPIDELDVPGFGSILVKRDDLCGDSYAGNKVRKLEFLLAEARAAGARRLITVGAAGSHHALATAIHGIANGFAVSLVLFPQPRTSHVRDIVLMDHAAGAELRWVSRMERVPIAVWRARRAYRREHALVIPPGGSNPTGAFGYVSAALELETQLRENALAAPSRIHVAAGTLGTAAGIAIGLAWAGLDVPVIATRITSRIVTNERALAKLVRRTIARLRSAGAEPPEPAAALRLIELRHDQIGSGYGRTTPHADDAMERFARIGLSLDTTYTAKAAAGLIHGPPPPASPAANDRLPLFWQTLSAIEPRHLLGNVRVTDLPEPFASYISGGFR